MFSRFQQGNVFRLERFVDIPEKLLTFYAEYEDTLQLSSNESWTLPYYDILGLGIKRIVIRFLLKFIMLFLFLI